MSVSAFPPRGRTTFVIAHRLATIRQATRILVFDNGQIVENGNFKDLMALDGVFAALARAQFLHATPDAGGNGATIEKPSMPH